MTALQHTHLEGIAEYADALDTVCRQAKHDLYLFEKNFDGLGFNSEARYETLRQFLLGGNSLHILAHDTHYLTTLCPRVMMLLRQFDQRMAVRQTAKHQLHITTPFCVADNTHYVRRFHFDDPRGLLALNDPENACTLASQFMEMWRSSHSNIPISTLGL